MTCTPLLELYDRQGGGEAPFPPQFPKMPGEPLRVQLSRAKRPKAGESGSGESGWF